MAKTADPADLLREQRRARTRVTSSVPLLAAAALLAACGSGAHTTTTPPAHTSSSTSSDDTHTDSTSTGSGGITVSDVVFSSTLKTPTTDFGVKGNVHEDASGTSLTVANAGGGYTFSTPIDLHGIPDSFDVNVKIDEPQQNGLYAGVACRGLDQNNTYLMLVDAKGDYAIVRVQAGNQTLLKRGNAAFSVSWPISLDAACVSPDGDDNTNRLQLSAGGTVLASVDDSIENVAASNSYALFAMSPNADTGTGSVLFHDLSVSNASSP